MYSKIAFSNVKKSIRDYTIYFLTLTFGICLFYMFNSVQAQQAVLKLNASQKSMMHLMSVIINGISVFVAIILGFLIVYANQFLMKRRHKEMGIYLLLGMEKRQVSKILLIETLLIGVLALIAGLVSGVFLSQGLAMLTAKMFAVQMKEFRFVFSQTAFIQTILYFVIIFIIVMIFNGITISKYKLINLLNSAKKNQKARLKNPILSVILFLISIGILGVAYHLIQKNQMLAVDNDFKISVILGVAGTFLFFFSLSGFLLELAKRSKKFYYNGLNMFVLRQINSKITTTFVSMSMLCLMLFLAISAFATGSGLASSVKTDLEDMTKFDYTFYGVSEKGYQEEQQQKFMKRLDALGLTIEKDAKEITKLIPEKSRNSVLAYNVKSEYYIVTDIVPCYKYFMLQDWMCSVNDEMQEEFKEYIESGQAKYIVENGENNIYNENDGTDNDLDYIIDEKYEEIGRNDSFVLMKRK